MDYTRLKNERITNTKIGPYDMITAVSQGAINAQLKALHKVNKSLRKLSLAPDDPKIADITRLDADLNPPTIELRLNTENHIVIFCLNISKATLTYPSPKFDHDDIGLVKSSIDIPTCTLALSVNLAFESVEFSKLPQEVQNRLKVKNNYSVKQLLIDFTSANLAKLDKQASTIYNHIQDSVASAHFDIFIQKYFAQLARENDFILHYVPLATKALRQEYAMPTVPPTDITFQNIPFLQDNKDNGGPSDNNMLVYLQMCNDHVMPKEPLAISANWVVPTETNTDRYDGTVALSADTFLNGWLLKRLSDFNKRSSWVVDDVWWKGNLISTTFHMSGHLGRTNVSDSAMDWVAVSGSDVDENVRNKVAGQTGQWYKYYFRDPRQDNKGAWDVWQTGTTTNWLFIPTPEEDKGGKCEIFVCGTTFIEFYVKIDLFPSDGWVKGEWSTKIVFDGVHDGELNIKADNINPVITRKIDEAWLHSGNITTFSKPAEDDLNNLSMTDVIDEMRSVFENSWDFVIPGGADFYINKAVFNKEKDLICELKYKFKTT